ncbi:MAG: hypothetical protein K2H96_03375 [Muribaculaceae bacterium]|nr:hypothetical protein [Muribaculaceae bacterium]
MESQQFQDKIPLTLAKINKTSFDLLMRCGKDDLRGLFKTFCQFVRSHCFEIKRSDSLELSNIFHSLTDPKKFNSLHKEALAKLYISLCCDLNNIFHLAKGEAAIEDTWLKILQCEEFSSDLIEKRIGRKLDVAFPSYWGYGYYVEPLFSPLVVTEASSDGWYVNRNKETKFTFSLFPSYRGALVKLFMGEQALNPKIFPAIPTKDGMRVENFENTMASDIAFLSGLSMTGTLPIDGGNISAAKLKSIKKKYNAKCFCIETGEYPLDRIELLANAFCFFVKNKNYASGAVKVEEFAKFIVNDYPKNITATRISPFLPAFKGFTKSWADITLVPELVKLISSLLLPSSDGWMSMDNFKLRFLCLPVRKWTTDCHNGLFSATAKQRHCLKRRDEDQYYRTEHVNWFKDIDFPFVIHWIKFLCAAGIIEIAYNIGHSSMNNLDDCLEGMEYVRLTPLGRFVFGFEKKYKTPEVMVEDGLEVDEKNGILTLSSTESPFSIFLSQITEPISSNRFRLTARSIMKGCDKKEEVEERIHNLRAILNKEEADKLKGWFCEINDRLNCLVPIEEKWIAIRLRGDLPELIDLIINNKEIRPKIVLAEKGVVLVKSDFYPRLKQICRENGFLI